MRLSVGRHRTAKSALPLALRHHSVVSDAFLGCVASYGRPRADAAGRCELWRAHESPDLNWFQVDSTQRPWVDGQVLRNSTDRATCLVNTSRELCTAMTREGCCVSFQTAALDGVGDLRLSMSGPVGANQLIASFGLPLKGKAIVVSFRFCEGQWDFYENGHLCSTPMRSVLSGPFAALNLSLRNCTLSALTIRVPPFTESMLPDLSALLLR